MFGVLAMTMAVSALGVLGVGQTVYEKNRAQRIVDLGSMAAASQMDDGPTFPIGREVALRNGLSAADEVQFTCLANGVPTDNCNDANTVRMVLNRRFSPLFLGPERTVTAQAEATLAPVVTGLISSDLAAINTQQSALLNGLLRTLPGGGSLNLSVLEFNKLLGGQLQVGLLPLAANLGVGGLDQLASVNVSALNLLDQSLNLAQGDPLAIANARSVLSGLSAVLSGVNLNLGSVLGVDLASQTQGVVNLDFGQLALVTLLNTGKGKTLTLTSVDLGLAGFGLKLDITLIEPPQVFVGRKLPGKTPVATGKVAQAAVRAKISGLSALGFSLAEIELVTKLAGGVAQVTDLECRIPRANNNLSLTIQPSATSVCVTEPGAVSNSTLTGGSGLLSCPSKSAKLIKTPLLSVKLGGGAQVQPNAEQVYFTGPAPYQETVALNTGSTLANLFSNINLNLDVDILGIGLGPLLNVGLITSTLNALLGGVLGQVGGVLDGLLATLGVTLNNVNVNINSVDCQAAVLTK